MADDRIYLKCNNCGEELFLGKSFFTAFYFEEYDGIPLKQKLNEFYDKHFMCGGLDHKGKRWWGDYSLSFEYDFDEEEDNEEKQGITIGRVEPLED